MDRRKALSIVTLLFGGTVVGSGAFLSGCKPVRKIPLNGLLNIDDKLLMDEIGETILPRTPDAPGGRELRIGSFINTIVSDCYSGDEQVVFMKGLRDLNERSHNRFGKVFTQLGMEEKNSVIENLEEESKQAMDGSDQVHYYQMLKQLTVWAYLSSRKVSVDVLGYVPVPGRYDGCVPYHQGDKAIL